MFATIARYLPEIDKETEEKYHKYARRIFAGGASLIIGLLSFGGMYALIPFVIPSLISSVLATIYEGHIYSENWDRFYEKMKSSDYFENQLPKYYLERYFQDSKTPNRVPFFELYEEKIRQKRTEAVKEELDALEALFAEQIGAGKDFEGTNFAEYADYAEELHRFLHAKKEEDGTSIHEDYEYSRKRRIWLVPLLKFFGFGVTALFMSIGTTYLLVELFTLVPLLSMIPFSVLPIIIVPASIIAGIAYGGLTFNALTNLMANDTFLRWWRRIRDDFKRDGFSLKHATMTLSVVSLTALALTLTICTAGTWLTIARSVRPLFGWMKYMPAPIMHVINPIIMWISSFAFNVENTSGTLHELFPEPDPKVKPAKSVWQQFKEACSNAYNHVKEKENLKQRLNPWRMALMLVLSMRYVFFLGHLISIGVTADRIPGLSQYISAGLGALGEGTEDWHYFFSHSHANDLKSLLRERLGEAQGHSHGEEDEEDLPTQLVNWAASYLYKFSAKWDAHYSQFNEDPAHRYSYEEALKRQKEPFIAPDPEHSCGPNCNDCGPKEINFASREGGSTYKKRFKTLSAEKLVQLSLDNIEKDAANTPPTQEEDPNASRGCLGCFGL